ncbi:MAG: thiamine phosphate synthase [Candidatus Methanomethylophilaceae archaeon]|jgi:thiamine-phosphate pyrophosphorylase|nr:thiamine phosphate synthase [Candidatus Methanomethylophilaceae archaeon]MBP5684848.1 thiamine phosphate synthase [Candidatus Methanomethylophilaceae archaeon]MBP5735740.1 thiamine phosphate synthase [Candidatus Methanomethylophilaceae archaeon]
MFDLYVVTDESLSKGRSNVEIARMAYEGGADVVQLRMKNASKEDMLRDALKIKEIADDFNKFFIVNDNIEVAIESEADGVHLGQSDMPLEKAVEMMDYDRIIGISVTTVEEALKAEAGGASYVGVGSIFATSTKPDAAQSLGLDAIYTIRQAVDIPIVAIGGINQGNIQSVIKAGADCAAVVSAVVAQDDVKKAAHDLRDLILKARL